jgi:hypothetical protein
LQCVPSVQRATNVIVQTFESRKVKKGCLSVELRHHLTHFLLCVFRCSHYFSLLFLLCFISFQRRWRLFFCACVCVFVKKCHKKGGHPHNNDKKHSLSLCVCVFILSCSSSICFVWQQQNFCGVVLVPLAVVLLWGCTPRRPRFSPFFSPAVPAH